MDSLLGVAVSVGSFLFAAGGIWALLSHDVKRQAKEIGELKEAEAKRVVSEAGSLVILTSTVTRVSTLENEMKFVMANIVTRDVLSSELDRQAEAIVNKVLVAVGGERRSEPR